MTLTTILKTKKPTHTWRAKWSNKGGHDTPLRQSRPPTSGLLPFQVPQIILRPWLSWQQALMMSSLSSLSRPRHEGVKMAFQGQASPQRGEQTKKERKTKNMERCGRTWKAGGLKFGATCGSFLGYFETRWSSGGPTVLLVLTRPQPTVSSIPGGMCRCWGEGVRKQGPSEDNDAAN